MSCASDVGLLLSPGATIAYAGDKQIPARNKTAFVDFSIMVGFRGSMVCLVRYLMNEAETSMNLVE